MEKKKRNGTVQDQDTCHIKINIPYFNLKSGLEKVKKKKGVSWPMSERKVNLSKKPSLASETREGKIKAKKRIKTFDCLTQNQLFDTVLSDDDFHETR